MLSLELEASVGNDFTALRNTLGRDEAKYYVEMISERYLGVEIVHSPPVSGNDEEDDALSQHDNSYGEEPISKLDRPSKSRDQNGGLTVTPDSQIAPDGLSNCADLRSPSKSDEVEKASLLYHVSGFFYYKGQWKDAEEVQMQAIELRRGCWEMSILTR